MQRTQCESQVVVPHCISHQDYTPLCVPTPPLLQVASPHWCMCSEDGGNTEKIAENNRKSLFKCINVQKYPRQHTIPVLRFQSVGDSSGIVEPWPGYVLHRGFYAGKPHHESVASLAPKDKVNMRY